MGDPRIDALLDELSRLYEDRRRIAARARQLAEATRDAIAMDACGQHRERVIARLSAALNSLPEEDA